MGIKVVIVEDQQNTLESLYILLNGATNLEVIGAYCTGAAALKEIPELTPDLDVVLIDLGLPDISGIEVIKRLKNDHPSLNILVLTIYEDRQYLFPALKAGASGYLLKESTPSEIIEAIEEIYRGGAPMSSRIARYVIEYFHNNHPMNAMTTYALTTREKEVLTGLVEGLTYKNLAERLSLSPHTIRTHIKRIYEKLHVHSRWEAISIAKKKGMI